MISNDFGLQKGLNNYLEKKELFDEMRADQDANDVKVTLANLGGQQVQLPKSEFKFEKIPARGAKDFFVRIEGADKIESPSIVVGISVAATSGFEILNTVSEFSTALRVKNGPRSDGLSH